MLSHTLHILLTKFENREFNTLVDFTCYSDIWILFIWGHKLRYMMGDTYNVDKNEKYLVHKVSDIRNQTKTILYLRFAYQTMSFTKM